MHKETTLKNSRLGSLTTEPVVDISRLSFSWSKTLLPVLEMSHFRVESGELLFIMGPSGSGKSTLLGLLTGILTPQQGEVRVQGQNISQLKGAARDRFRADNIGYIFQIFNLIPYLSVVENVTLPCQFSSLRKKKIQEQGTTPYDEALRLLAHLNLTDPGLLEKPVVELSVGQQQRVAAARALIGSPSLVIADEPTSSLDTEHRESFLRLLFSECSRSGATLIFVSHDTSLMPLFDRVVEFKKINTATGIDRGGDA
ncbi:ABC transporter ATP-binding protein [Desulforhopalus sp. IMCC35007]|uniref:ABC transporter ATP-binding protein n=1 Tax=Desulforhopalus sp. IMCC35007 TaxID=2569543 RepID=UPI0010ADEE61|nr:ABC transporter ATP-binding protein [Desulforhopalus sp. IMCC35007]TKB06799.1 ABC transporter ATP-binding protein [Desulforhopalus sp. IMCC35007]